MAEPINQSQVIHDLASNTGLFQLFNYSTTAQLIMFLITVIAVVIATYFGARLKHSGKLDEISAQMGKLVKEQKRLSEASKTGEIEAISKNIEEMKFQLGDFETVKHGVELDHWRRKEIELVRREKLEECLLLLTGAIDRAFDFYSKHLRELGGFENLSWHCEPLDKANVIVNLYFIELSSSFAAFFDRQREFTAFVLDSRQAIVDRTNKLLASGKELEVEIAFQRALEKERQLKVSKEFQEYYLRMTEAKDKVFEQAFYLADKLNS